MYCTSNSTEAYYVRIIISIYCKVLDGCRSVQGTASNSRVGLLGDTGTIQDTIGNTKHSVWDGNYRWVGEQGNNT